MYSPKGLILGTCVTAAFGLFSLQASAATLTLDFDVSFGDPTDPDTAAPDGPTPWMTAFFDDGGSAGSVDLVLTVSPGVGNAAVTGVYLNVDDAIGAESLAITPSVSNSSVVSSETINRNTNTHKAGNDGLFDILIELPPPGDDRFTAGESLNYSITAAGLLASSFNFFSAPDPSELDPSGPFLGAAKFQTTGDGLQSDWVGAVPVPAAVWLFGSGLLGLVGIARRKHRV
ncbi:MAG: VPLPA-CTERM sorting domain-containing protein [Thiotrichales bacterium]|nr:MAG: VPLPA-CTERM sorting domain-containing protein [Thiotrichales bacterium]